MLSVSKLYKYYGVDKGNLGISFTLDDGKIFVVYGNKDSGKSLLLKQLAKIIEPDFGEIKIDNHNLDEIKNLNDNLSYYSYNEDFWSRIKVKDYLSLVVKERNQISDFLFTDKVNQTNIHETEVIEEENINKLSKKESQESKKLKKQQFKKSKLENRKKKVNKKEKNKSDKSINESFILDTLGFFNINPKLMICNISPEQRRILLMMVAIMNRDKIILIDDFGVNMEIEARDFFKKEFIKLAQEGHTIVITSRNKDTLNDIASKIMYLDKGKVIDILNRG